MDAGRRRDASRRKRVSARRRRWAMMDVDGVNSAPSNSVDDARSRRRRRRRQVYVSPVQGEQALCWVRQAAPRRPASLPPRRSAALLPPLRPPQSPPPRALCRRRQPLQPLCRAAGPRGRRDASGRTAATESAAISRAEFNVNAFLRRWSYYFQYCGSSIESIFCQIKNQ